AVLQHIVKLFGPISSIVWPGVVRLPLYQALAPVLIQVSPQSERMSNWSLWNNEPAALSLADSCLAINPAGRLKAYAAADHDFFWKGERARPLRELLDTLGPGPQHQPQAQVQAQ